MGGIGAGGGRLLNNYANKYKRTDEAEREQNDERERFINAISRQESNGDYTAVNERTGASGKYQIMPENWVAWAKEAGLDPNAEMTPENQEIVARHKLGEYYDKYGAAGAVQAWYAGEGSFDYDEEALNRKQGNGDEPSIREYVESVMQRMGNTFSEDNTETIQDTSDEDYDESDNEFDKLTKEEKEESDTYLENADKENESANEQNKETAPKEETENKEKTETAEYVAEPENDYYDDTENQSTQYPSYPKRDLNKKRIFALKQLYEKNKKSNIINGIIQKARNEQAERKQRELDYSWYLKESKRNQGSEQGVDRKLIQQALGDKRIEMLTDRAVSGDKSAQKAFENITSPAVREALLNRKQQYNGNAQRALASQNKVQPDVLPSVEPTPRNSRAIDSRNMNEMIAASRKNVPETQLNKSNKLDYLTTEWSDDKNPLLKIERELEAITGKEISVDESAYYQARMANSSAASRIQMAIRGDKKNRKHWYDALNDVFNGQWKEDVSFQDIVDKVSEFDKLATSDKDAKNYLDKNNFKNGLDVLSAYLLSNRYLEIWEKNPDYKSSVSKADAMATVESAPKAIKEAAELYYKFDQNLVNILHDSGMLNDKAYETISKYTRYCPLFRDFADEAAFNKFINRLGDANSYINLANGIKALTDVGSDRTVLDDPVKSMLRMTSSIIRKAEKNKVAQKFVAMSERSGVGKFVVPEFDAMGVQQKSADPQQSIFTVWRNGKQQAFRTTADIYELLEGNDNYASGLVDVLDNMVSRSAAKTLRIGATSSIPFMLANATKDTITAAFNSKNGFIPIIDTFRGIKLLATDSKFRATFESSGVGMSSIYKEDPDSLQDTLDKMAGNKWWQKFTPTKLAHTMLEHYLHYAELLENGARAGEFARALENDRSLLEAAISAKEVSTDFSRAGKSGRVANRIIQFFNAVIQGNTAVIRALRNPNAWKVGAGLAIATAILWSINKDEPWYEDLTLEEKLGAWHFGIGDGKHISIPKPEMYGLIFGGVVEATLEQAYEKDPKAVKGWTERFTAQTLPSFIPALYIYTYFL